VTIGRPTAPLSEDRNGDSIAKVLGSSLEVAKTSAYQFQYFKFVAFIAFGYWLR
jgi:hypothetical protein